MRKWWFAGVLAMMVTVGMAAGAWATGTVEIEEIAVGPRMFSSTFLSEDIIGLVGLIIVSLAGVGLFALHWAAGILAVVIALIVVGFMLGGDDILSAMGLSAATLGEAETARTPAVLMAGAVGMVGLVGWLLSRQGRQYLPVLVGIYR